MKSLTTFLLLFSLFSLSAQDTLRLKAEIRTGQPGYTWRLPMVMFSNSSDQDPWKKTEYEVTGLPEDGNTWYREMIWFQTYQWIYQNYKAGKVDSVLFSKLKESWQFETLIGEYTSREIASATTMFFRKNDKGQIEYYIDTDADRDFSDEDRYTAFSKLMYHQIDSALPYAPIIEYELFLNGKIQRSSVPIIVEEYGEFLTYTMPLYAEAVLGQDTLVINTSKPDFRRILLSEKADLNPASSGHDGAKKEEGERVKYSGQWYVVDHFDRASSELVLQVVDTLRDTVSATKGFYGPDFSFEEMTSEKEMSLKDLRGKYVLLDFWGTWCKPCITSLPELVQLKEDLKSQPFEIVSIAYSSNMESFEKLKSQYRMNWLHAWQPQHVGVMEDYAIRAYPTTFLLDPKGKIIAHNPSMKEIKEIVIQSK